MMTVTYIPRRLDGVELYQLLTKHRLLPKSMENPQVCVAMAESSDVGFLHEGDRVLAVIIETRPADKVLELIWVNEVSRLHTRRDLLIEAASVLRERWFTRMGMERIGVHIPIARTQTIRTIKAMGFRMETLPWGIRNCSGYGDHLESMAVLGLLPSDPIRSNAIAVKVEEPIILSEAG